MVHDERKVLQKTVQLLLYNVPYPIHTCYRNNHLTYQVFKHSKTTEK